MDADRRRMPRWLIRSVALILIVGFNVSAWLIVGDVMVLLWLFEAWAAFTLMRRGQRARAGR